MRVLLDTHLLIWIASDPERVSGRARLHMEAPGTKVLFSVASLWELAIKLSLGRETIRIDLERLRSQLIAHGYDELLIDSRHALAVANLPLLHKDPFDRLLIAQAVTEGATLLTADRQIAAYPGPIQRV